MADAGSQALWVALITISLAALSPFALLPLLRAVNAVDEPSSRSSHTSPTLRGLGLGVAIAVTLAALASASWSQTGGAGLWVTLGGAACYAILGFAEDVRGVSIRVRASLQVLFAALALVTLGTTLGAPPILAFILIGLVAFLTNATNFMDGINWISSLNSIVIGVSLLAAAVYFGVPWLGIAGAALAAGFAGFLPWNTGPRAYFLGDSGSYFMGAFAALSISGAIMSGVPALAVLAPIWIYLVDTIVTLCIRIVTRQPWSRPHRQHTYQRLVDRGLSHTSVAILVATSGAICALLGFFGSAFPSFAGVCIAAIILVGVLYRLFPRFVRHKEVAA